MDVRSPAEFTGEVIAPPGMTETAQRGGHVPGAQNVPWAQAVNEDGTFKSADELRELYGAKGVDNPSRSSPTAASASVRRIPFVLHYLLGFPDCKNYDGSWTDDGRRAHRKSVTILMSTAGNFYKKALSDAGLAQVVFRVAVLEPYLAQSGTAVTRTETAGRVKA